MSSVHGVYYEEDENTTQDAFVEELEIINHTDYAMDELEDAILEQYQLTVQVQNNSEADDMEEYVNAIPADSPKMVLVIEKEEEEQAFSFTVWMKPEGVLDNREAKNQMEDIADTNIPECSLQTCRNYGRNGDLLSL